MVCTYVRSGSEKTHTFGLRFDATYRRSASWSTSTPLVALEVLACRQLCVSGGCSVDAEWYGYFQTSTSDTFFELTNIREPVGSAASQNAMVSTLAPAPATRKSVVSVTLPKAWNVAPGATAFVTVTVTAALPTLPAASYALALTEWAPSPCSVLGQANEYG